MNPKHLTRELVGAKSTVDASVLVGGTLLWQNHDALSQCVANGVRVRFLFPRLTSNWLKEYVQAAGIPHSKYVRKIRANSEHARNLGATVRFHDSPVAVWFALIDRQVVVSKPVDFFGVPPLSIGRASPDVQHFAEIFDHLWNMAAAKDGNTMTGTCSENGSPDRVQIWTPRVFLCHASDDKAAVRDLYGRLAESNINPWLDEVDILPGQNWDLEITRAVERADAVVVLLSRRSTTKQGYLQKEIRTALETAAKQPEGTIFLIPARLEECDVPDSLRKWQYVDLFQGNGLERLLRALINCSPNGDRSRDAPQPD